MRAPCSMSAYIRKHETSIYLDFGVEVVAGLSLLLDRPLCCLECIREFIMRVHTSFLYMSTSVHVELDIRKQAELTLGYVCPLRSCRRFQRALR